MSITRRSAAAMLLAAPFVSRAACAATFPAPGGWPRATPASVGLGAAEMAQAQRYAQRWGGSGCVIRDGRLVLSWGSQSQLYNIQSATKTFGSVLLGMAVDAGRVGLTAAAQRYLPGIGAIPSANVAKGWLDEIRVDHLATHTAGFPKSRLPSALAARPGSRYIYSDGGTNWLAALLTRVLDQDLRTLAQARLFTPMGVPASAAQWSPMDAQFRMEPTCRFNGGMLANVDTMARLGYLYLNNGNWNGRQIVSSAFVRLSTSSYKPRLAAGLAGYGLLWWLTTVGSVRCYHSSGLYNNHTFVFPSLNMVVVRLGTDGWSEHGGSTSTFLRPIVAAT